MTDLKPCPFCGAGETGIVENGRMWTGMRYGDPVSVSVRHFCPPTPGCHTPEGCRENGCLGWCDEYKPAAAKP